MFYLLRCCLSLRIASKRGPGRSRTHVVDGELNPEQRKAVEHGNCADDEIAAARKEVDGGNRRRAPPDTAEQVHLTPTGGISEVAKSLCGPVLPPGRPCVIKYDGIEASRGTSWRVPITADDRAEESARDVDEFTTAQ